MKPAWDRLGEVYKASKSVVIGDVDCTTDRNRPLCAEHKVEGFPTIKYFNAETGKAGQTYEGERTFDDFLTFSNENLGQSCSNDFKSACSRKEKKVLKKYNSMTAEERAAIIKEADETVEKATKEAEAEGAKIQAEIERITEEKNAVVKAKSATWDMRLLNMVHRAKAEDD
jgi:protein disulfide-isomerase A6